MSPNTEVSFPSDSSYTAVNIGLVRRFREALTLYRGHRSPARIRRLIDEYEKAKYAFESLSGQKLRGKTVLDIGPGPFLAQSLLMQKDGNEVTAIDLEPIPIGFDFRAYRILFNMGGTKRIAKIVVRKLMGIDAFYKRSLRGNPHAIRVLQGNVLGLPLPSAQYDFVHSMSMLHSIPDPGAALNEMARVTKPGGIVFVSLHCYTSFNGCLDPRVISGEGPEKFHWMHLREMTKRSARSNCYLNRLRVWQWEELFSSCYPGCRIAKIDSRRDGLREVAERLIDGGEIDGYSLDELLCHQLDVAWQKPA